MHGSYAIGDKLRDLSICEKEQVKGFLIIKNETEKSENIEKHKNIKICNDILEASYMIANEKNGR